MALTLGKGHAVPGFEEGVKRTALGCASRVRVPGTKAYPQGHGTAIPAGASLVFDVTVVEVDGVEASSFDLERAKRATVLEALEPDELLVRGPQVSGETTAYRRLAGRDENELARLLGGARVVARTAKSVRWTGTSDVSATGLCIRKTGGNAAMTWDTLLKRSDAVLVKCLAPIRPSETLRDAPVVEMALDDFARYCLADDDGSMKPRYYLNGWEADEAHEIDDVDDKSARFLIDYEQAVTQRLFGADPKLLDIATNTANAESRRLTKVFVGPAGATTRLHRDNHGAHARLTVLEGTKLYVAFPPEDGPLLNADDKGQCYLDIFSSIPEGATCYAALVEEGETIFVPKNWWHAALSMSPSITIMRNFWSATNLDDLTTMQNALLETKLRAMKSAGLFNNRQ